MRVSSCKLLLDPEPKQDQVPPSAGCRSRVDGRRPMLCRPARSLLSSPSLCSEPALSAAADREIIRLGGGERERERGAGSTNDRRLGLWTWQFRVDGQIRGELLPAAAKLHPAWPSSAHAFCPCCVLNLSAGGACGPHRQTHLQRCSLVRLFRLLLPAKPCVCVSEI